METFIVIFFVFIILASFSKSGGKKTTKVKSRAALHNAALKHDWAKDAQKLKAAQRSVRTGASSLERYRREQRKRYKQQMKTNSGLWQSKHRIDKNRNRRTDWGSKGDKLLLSPSMLSIIGGGLLTVYLGLTAL